MCNRIGNIFDSISNAKIGLSVYHAWSVFMRRDVVIKVMIEICYLIAIVSIVYTVCVNVNIWIAQVCISLPLLCASVLYLLLKVKKTSSRKEKVSVGIRCAIIVGIAFLLMIIFVGP